MKARIRQGLLLQAMHNKGWHCIGHMAAGCKVGEPAIKKLLATPDEFGRVEIPRLDTLFKICDGCGISVQQLWGETGPVEKIKRSA